MDSYAEMAVRTGMARAIRQGYTDDMQAHDEHLVIISDHQDTCPLCIDWERSVLAIDDAGLNHPDCDGSLAEAEAAGLFHPNCQHSMTVYVPGLTIKASGKSKQGYTREMDLRGYQNRQKQRSMERQVRAWKRRQAVALTPEDERYARAKVQLWQQRLREHVDNTGLPRLYYREGGRVTLSAAARKLPPTKLPGMAPPVQRKKSAPAAPQRFNIQGHGFSDDYRRQLESRFASGLADAQRAYDKYVPYDGSSIEVWDTDVKTTGSFFDPATKGITMNVKDDATNTRGPGATWFHEHGHFVDDKAGYPSRDSAFLKALKKDKSDYEKQYKYSHNLRDMRDVRFRLSWELSKRGDITSAIQDLYDGINGKAGGYSMRWRHERGYWNNVTICEEAFAHMFEASFSAERRALIEEFFPTAWKEFQRILEGV